MELFFGVICTVLYAVLSAKVKGLSTNCSLPITTIPDPNATTTTDLVLLHAPINLSVPYIFSSEAVVAWMPPQNIPLKDVILKNPFNNGTEPEMEKHINETSFTVLTKIDPLKNGSSAIQYEPENATDAETEESSVTLLHLPTGEPVTVQKNWNDTKNLIWVEKPCDEVMAYLVFYYMTSKPEGVTEMRLADNSSTELRITHIKAGTSYTVSIQVVYAGGVRIESAPIEFITRGFGADRKCECNLHGRQPQNPSCNPKDYNWCKCREGYHGLFCELCKPGFYRVAPNFPCHRCPCSRIHSSGNCRFLSNQVRCTYCYTGYSGNLCHKCIYGYYSVNGRCERCNCNGNQDIRQAFMCSPLTGQCMGCLHNTSGHYCQVCAPGYDGDALHAKNCTLQSEIEARKAKAKTGVGIIATVCVVIILSLSALAGLIVYRKWNHFPSMKSFWTVELRDNHESVSFSGIPDDEQTATQARSFDDMAFYEKQNKKGKELSYTPLTEDM